MRISLAAIPYFWSREDYISFYHQVAFTSVDIVYLGETVCSKRRSMKFQDWLDIAGRLSQAGKQVVLSTLTLLEADSELKVLSHIAGQKDYLIEANDMAAIQVAKNNDNAFVAGSAINVYNNQVLRILHAQGMTRWSIPVELGQQDIVPMVNYAHSMNIELEYQVFGRMPLAYSARCFTARHHQLAKDDCQFKCLDYEQGIKVKTQEGDSFAQINGIQTQSAKISNLFDQWQELKAVGIDILRIVPVSAVDTIKAINKLDALLQTGGENGDTLTGNYEFCNGYWYGVEGMKYIASSTASK
jgi:O2-independent ubiquinone biosynthesis protein UbiV